MSDSQRTPNNDHNPAPARRPRLHLVLAAAAILSLTAGTATARQLITGRDIKRESITGANIKNGSLTAADFRGSVAGKPGPQGPQGLTGQAGPAGPPGPVDIKVIDSPTVTVPPGSNTYRVAPSGLTATCPTGYVVVGTGFRGQFGDMWFVKSYGTFVGGFGTNDASISAEFEVQAICARSSAAGTATAAWSGNNAALQRFQKDARAMERRAARR